MVYRERIRLRRMSRMVGDESLRRNTTLVPSLLRMTEKLEKLGLVYENGEVIFSEMEEVDHV